MFTVRFKEAFLKLQSLLEGLILSVLGFPHVDLLGPPLSTGGEIAGMTGTAGTPFSSTGRYLAWWSTQDPTIYKRLGIGSSMEAALSYSDTPIESPIPEIPCYHSHAFKLVIQQQQGDL